MCTVAPSRDLLVRLGRYVRCRCQNNTPPSTFGSHFFVYKLAQDAHASSTPKVRHRGGLQTQLRMALQRVRRLQATATKRIARIVELEKKLDAFEFEFRLKPKRARRSTDNTRFGRFSIDGAYRLAIKQRFTYGATESTLRALNVPACNKIVNQWEQRLAVNILQQTISWQQQHMGLFDDVCPILRDTVAVTHPTRLFASWSVLRVQCDGTNVPAAQQHKAHCLRAVMVYRHPYVSDVLAVADGEEDTALPRDQCRREAWAELQKIPDSCGGAECRAMILKQLATLGMPTWLPDVRFGPDALPSNLLHIRNKLCPRTKVQTKRELAR